MAIRLMVVGIEKEVAVFPGLGKIAMMIRLEGGLRREMVFPLSALDQIAVSMLDLVERSRFKSAEQGYGHDIKPEELTTSFPATPGYRLLSLPQSNQIGLQVRVPGTGVVGFALTPEQASNLARELAIQLENLDANKRKLI